MVAISRPCLWLMIVMAMVATAIGMAVAGFSVDLMANPLLIAQGVIALSLPLWRKAPGQLEARLTTMFELIAMFTLLSILGALGTYIVAAGSSGYTDPALAAADIAMGFDWVAAYHFVAERPWLILASRAAYLSIFMSPVIVLAGLALGGRWDRGYQFLACFELALGLTLIAFHYFPARGAIDYHVGVDVAHMPAAGVGHIDVIEAARAGALGVVDPTRLFGIITFPSFHATTAVLLIWGAWPVRLLRWPMAALNVAMIVATPVEGGHYLIDVFGGIAIAGLAIAALHLFARIARPGSVVRLRPLAASE